MFDAEIRADRRIRANDRIFACKEDAEGVWSSPSGARIAWFKDPDGNTLSLTQLSR